MVGVASVGNNTHGCGDHLVLIKAVCWWVWSQLYHLPQHLHHLQLVLSLFPLPLLQFHLLPPLFSFLEFLFRFKLRLHEHVHTLLYSFLHFSYIFLVSGAAKIVYACVRVRASVCTCECMQVCVHACSSMRACVCDQVCVHVNVCDTSRDVWVY